jgi:glycosyltransferase involved in cell wall biosynthesis
MISRLSIYSPLRLEYGGGFERFCIAFASYAATCGIDVRIICLDWVPESRFRISNDTIRSRFSGTSIRYVLLPVRHLRTSVVNTPIPRRPLQIASNGGVCDSDVIYFNNAYFLQDIFLLCTSRINSRTPIVSGQHAVMMQDKLAHDTMLRVSLATYWNRFSAFHVLNDEDLGFLRARVKVPVFRLPIPVDDVFFRPSVGTRRNRRCRILFLGRLEWQKGVDLLVSAIEALSLTKLRGNFEITIAGSGTLHPAVCRLAANLPNVRVITPDEDEKAQLLRESDYLIMPSRRESFGIVAAEALMSGLPLIATKQPGVIAFVRDGEHGFIIPEPTTEAVLAAMIRAIDVWTVGQGELDAMSSNCRELAELNFSNRRVQQRYIEMLDQVSVLRPR